MQQPEIQITRAKRKTLSMRFDDAGVLQVRAPKYILNGQIQKFLTKHNDWIVREYGKILERQQTPKEYYLFGEKLDTIPPTHFRSLLPLIRGD